MPLLTAPLRPAGGPLRRPLVLARLILRVGHDVVRSALQVGRGVLRARAGGRRAAASCAMPLDLRDPHALAALAMITTVVPGTVWTELAPDRSALLLHVFDLDDEADFIAHYKDALRAPAEGDLRMSPVLSLAITATLVLYALAHGRWPCAPAARPDRAGPRAGAGLPVRRRHAGACWCWRSATTAACTSKARC